MITSILALKQMHMISVTGPNAELAYPLYFRLKDQINPMEPMLYAMWNSSNIFTDNRFMLYEETMKSAYNGL